MLLRGSRLVLCVWAQCEFSETWLALKGHELDRMSTWAKSLMCSLLQRLQTNIQTICGHSAARCRTYAAPWLAILSQPNISAIFDTLAAMCGYICCFEVSWSNFRDSVDEEQMAESAAEVSEQKKRIDAHKDKLLALYKARNLSTFQRVQQICQLTSCSIW